MKRSLVNKLNLYPFAWGSVLLTLAGLAYASDRVTPATYEFLFKEDGLIEVLSASGYFVAFALLLAYMIKKKKPDCWSLCAILFCFGLRELDFDKKFTTMGIFKSRFYLSSEVFVSEKIVGVCIILALLTCLFFMVKAYARPFLTKLKALDPFAITLLLAGGCIALSKSLDGLPRKLKPFGIVVSNDTKMLSAALEESLELMIPLLVIVAIIGAFCAGQKSADKR
jgi:hypothetical protein